MSRTELTDDELIDRVERTLRAKAARVAASTERFDPTPRLRGDPTDPPLRHRHRRMAAVVAAVVVIVCAVSAAVIRTRDPAEIATASAGDVPDGILAPTAVPEGFALWGVTLHRGGAGATVGTSQLFTRDDGAAVLVYVGDLIGPDSDGIIRLGRAETVRGQRGKVRSFDGDGEPYITVRWHEGGTRYMQATVTGMPEEQALGFLESLRWRSDRDQLQGVVAPPDSGFEVREGTVDGTLHRPSVSATFSYYDSVPAPAEGDGRQLAITTWSATGALPHRYLDARIHDEPAADGRVEWYDAEARTLVGAWPDGRQYEVIAGPDPSLSEEELREVADAVEPVPGSTVESMIADASDRVADLPLVAAADLPSGTLELRGEDRPLALCLRIGDERACPALDPLEPPTRYDPVIASLVVDGRWYVAGAGRSDAEVTVAPPDEQIIAGAGWNWNWEPLPTESAVAGDWVLTLARPRDGVDHVGIEVDRNGTTLERPGP